MPLSKARVLTHSKHFPQIANQTSANSAEQHGSLVVFHSTRNRSPSCGSYTSQSIECIPDKTTKSDKPEATIKQGFCKIIFRTLLLVLLYYLSSIGLTFYQKWLMRVNMFKKFPSYS